MYSPVKPLVGTRQSAQRYVDRVTRSPWWQANGIGFFNPLDPPPERVWVWEGGEDVAGLMDAGVVADLGAGIELPSITLGKAVVHGNTPAIADKWVILHEMAHVMTNQVPNDGHHGKYFCHAYINLTRQFLGPVPARNLIYWSKWLKIRLDSRLLPS